MEVGVLNGENARTMTKVAAECSSPNEIEYYGFDFFEGNALHQVEYKLEKTGCKFKLFRGDTTDTLPEATRTLPKMDPIFIDGGKSYSEAKSDWESSKTLMHDETTVFVHNCHNSGVERMINEIPRKKYHVSVISPPNDSDTAVIKKK
ncbi:MAG: class I SAM-dependent methyltransferase [archaeon]